MRRIKKTSLERINATTCSEKFVPLVSEAKNEAQPDSLHAARELAKRKGGDEEENTTQPEAAAPGRVTSHQE